jgi:hypothetical protein
VRTSNLERCWLAILAGLAAVWLLGWVPHYLTWPWWIDLDTYAWIAQSWSVGRLPYRDVTVFNFPGQIYLFRLIGLVAGWGNTRALYGFDVALLLTLGAVLCAWSVRVLGRAAPGILAFVFVLSYYLDQDVRNVAQRDWHGPVLAVIALLVLETYRSGVGLAASAVLLAMAFVVRPHVALFGPAFVVALWPDRNLSAIRALERQQLIWRPGAMLTRSRFLGFCIVFACAVVVLLSPIVLSGAFGNMVQNLRQVGYGTRYAKLGRFQAAETFAWQLGLFPPDASLREPTGWLRQADRLKLAIVIACSVFYMMRVSWFGPVRRTNFVWVTVGVCMLMYAPLHPMRHLYLTHPLRLAVGVNLALLAARVLEKLSSNVTRLAAFALFTGLAVMPGWPRFWSIDRGIAALGALGTRNDPAAVPMGAADQFAPGDARSPYSWSSYRDVLVYLRKNVKATQLVANLLRNVPFPAINGAVGRVSPLDAEGGVAFLYLVDLGREASFARLVAEAPTGSVVVWDPEQPSFTPDLKLETIRQAVRSHYEPEARFGVIEVWRKHAARGGSAH